MFQSIHPRYQTLRRRRVTDRETIDLLHVDSTTLDAIYRRIDDDLAEL